MSATDGRPTLTAFEPLSPEYLRNPFPVWSQAHREAPVFFHPELGFWVLTRHADIAAAASDWETFSSRATDFVAPPPDLADRIPANFFVRNAILSLDPPEHTVSRKVCNRSFTRGRVERMEPVVRAFADELIDELADRGRCDLMADFAYKLSLRVIVHMLGLPESDSPLFVQWTEDHFALMTPRSSAGGAEQRPMPEAERHERWTRILQALEYYRQVIEERRANPGDDMISDMVTATDEHGAPALSDERIMLHAQEMVAAGNDTTANMVGTTVMYLTADREQFDRVRREPAQLDRVVEEGLRRHSSARGVPRFTTRDVTIAGVEIPAGSVVYLAFQAAGHDEEVFSDPLRFDIDRPNAADHLTFGRGRHFCMGAPIARLEVRQALAALLERLPRLRVVPGQTLEYAPVMTGSLLLHLDVEWD